MTAAASKLPCMMVVVGLILVVGRPAVAQNLVPLDIAYAGSMGALMDGGVKPAVARALGVELRGRAQGSTGLAHLIAAESIRPDVFIAVTPEPMRIVLRAGKAGRAVPIARTEMVIAYNARSRYGKILARAGHPGGPPWWRVLETPGFRFGRTDPLTDPQGLNIVFTMQLAAAYYHQPALVAKILGPLINRRQIFEEPQVMARVQSGQLDASSAYKTQPAALGLQYISLPAAINLGDAAMEGAYRQAAVELNGRTFRPQPLVFYAAPLTEAARPTLAAQFVQWLQGAQARQIFRRYHYDPPGDAQPLTR